ncbi:MAG: TonB-dependent receptor [Sphingomonadales bacterium]|nr:TonB-dependent receptor [Sphingomonadales bacterium]
MKRLSIQSCVSVIGLAIASLSTPVHAQAAQAPAAADKAAEGDSLSEIVVTATAGSRSKLDTSVSISSVDAAMIQDFHPMSEGDMLRLLPGLQPNISGPGGNGNFAVRGLPVATGGATFVQLQEDGLPTVLYGDMQFGNNDYWTKSSPTDDRIEAIRGGTAATLASQAPGAVVNYISKTSRSEGGYIQLEKNLTYDYTKASFLYSGSINDSTYYNVGGYYDVGHGPWHTGYNLSNSYLIKGNITKEFADNKGYFRLLFKAQDTREPNTQGGIACGKLSGGKVTGLTTCPGFDARKASNFSLYNTNVNYIDFNSGGLAQHPLDGITTKAKSIQAQLHYKFDNGLTVDNNARYTSMSGGFASNFLSVSPISGLIGSTVNGGVVARAVYAAGPQKGQNVAEAYYDNNVQVWTRIRDVGSFVNDTKLSWNGDLGTVKASLTAGWFYMNQKIAMDWHPNQFNSSISPNSSPIDLLNSAGALLSANGFTGYNNNWGGCCARTYDYAFTDNAPYADLILDAGKFELDASIRHDINHGSGSGTNANPVTGNAVTHTIVQSAVNPVTGASQNVAIPYYLPDGATEVMNYTVPLTSWSVGASYKAMDNLNLFVRASKGTRFNADRMSFNGYFNADGTLNTAGKTAAADYVYQYEIGLKNRGTIGAARYTVELTLYHSHFNITTYELSQTVCPIVTGSATTFTCIVSDKYKTTGAEFYGTLNLGGFNLLANLTYNKAKKQPSGPNTVYARSNNIPDLSYTLAANYNVTRQLSLGADLTGVTSTLDGAGNQWPGGTVFGANVKIRPVDNLQIGVNVYNLFNKLTPLGPAGTDFSTGGGGFIGGISPVLGRSFTASAKFNF